VKIRKRLCYIIRTLSNLLFAGSVPVGLPLCKFVVFRSLLSPSTNTCSFFVWFVLNVEPRHQGNDGKKEDDTQAERRAGKQLFTKRLVLFLVLE